MEVRIYNLAKDLGLDSKVLLDLCTRIGILNKGSALASLDGGEITKIKSVLATGKVPETNYQQATGDELTDEKVDKIESLTTDMIYMVESYGALRVSEDNQTAYSHLENSTRQRSVSSLINAVSSDMFRGFEHLAVIELGALFESILHCVDRDFDNTSGLKEAIEKNCDDHGIAASLLPGLVMANKTRNAIVHRRPGKFPDKDQITAAKQVFAIAIIDMHLRHKHLRVVEHLADSNREFLNALDAYFGLDG